MASPVRSTLHRRATLVLVLLATPLAWSQGRIFIERPGPDRPLPHPGQTELTLRSLNVQTRITDGVAVSTVRQTFHNPLAGQVEGTYVFPLPDDVAVGDFSMTVNGKTLHGEVLDADQARRTYEQIVRRVRDPGLLEYLGQRLFRASIFPIPANGDVDVQLSYTQTLAEQDGLGLYRHPLRATGTRGLESVQQVALSVKLESSMPLMTVFSPSHECDIVRPDNRSASVAFEATNASLDRDFLLYYQRQDAEFGLAVLTHRGPAEPGTFLLRIAPRIDLDPDEILPKDIAFVFDTSGSMAGDKIRQARQALKFCIDSLNPDDRFNIYAFSTDVHPFRDALVPADGDVRDAAHAFADQLKPVGGTNINAALLDALADNPRDPQRVYLVVFMTDGLPTIDVIDPQRILENVAAQNTAQVRIHVLGVGSEVNTHLLDKLAEQTRASREYCAEKEDLEIKLSGLVRRLANPVMTNLKLEITGVKTVDVYPIELPDLYRGHDLVVLGRYEGNSVATITLEGQAQGRQETVSYEAKFPQLSTDNDFLPRLWANRKVAYLLDQIRLHGSNKELVDEVIRLATRYGIVTPYTSALILEEGTELAGSRPSWAFDEFRAAEIRARRLGGAPPGGRFGRAGSFGGRGEAAVADADGVLLSPERASASEALRQNTGAAAVDVSRELWAAKFGVSIEDQLNLAALDESAIRYVGSKVFVNINGRWVDADWDGQARPQPVVAFSDAYFALLARHKDTDVQRFLALGERVLFVLGETVYEIVPEPAAESAPAPARQGEAE